MRKNNSKNRPNNPQKKRERSSKERQTSFAKKNLGQNFLQSPEIRHNILEAAQLVPGENVLEIGPGLGFLTAGLLKKQVALTAVDLDSRVMPILKKEFGHKENFTLIEGDILVQNVTELFGGEPYKVVANIPYNITGPILRKFLDKEEVKPSVLILMVQKEVAHKICGPTEPLVIPKMVPETENSVSTIGLAAQQSRPGNAKTQGTSGDHKRSILGLSVEIFAETAIVCHVSRNLFAPIPKVDSAVILLKIRPEALIAPEKQKDFFTLVNAGFSQRRKKMGNYFGAFFGIESAALLGDIDPKRRAETLTVDEWKIIVDRFEALDVK